MQLIQALLQQKTDRIPAWMMRQAGRYLPEYLACRARVPDFIQFCKTPELACEVTLQPLRRFPLDAAIIFSDILTIPDALAVGVRFVENVGPMITKPIQTQNDVEALPEILVEEKLSYVKTAIEMVVRELKGKTPLIGFAGSPWTVASYMVEGGSSKLFSKIKKMIYSAPEIVHALLEKLTAITIDYLNMQIRAGAQVIQVFDTWGGVLSNDAFEAFSLQYLRKIAKGILREWNGQTIPLIFFTKGGGVWLEKMADSGCDALGLDWTIRLSDARARVHHKVALQGNLDPFVLLGAPAKIREEVRRLIQQLDGNFQGYVFNLGHGIERETPIQNVEILFNTLAEFT